MANHSDNTISNNTLVSYTAKGNVLYRFERLTQKDLDAYRVESYGYLM